MLSYPVHAAPASGGDTVQGLYDALLSTMKNGRTLGQSEPGGICISRMVRDQIRDKLPYPFEDMGERTFKNIARPVRVYALRPEAVAALPATSLPPATSISQPADAPRLSIVVLPFTNLSNDPDQQYFADGITEDLTTDLSWTTNMSSGLRQRQAA
jgi:adenylate cyclase